jgi:flavin-dependent dehydrogenase
MAAIALARAGAEPLLIDRDEIVGDALCGGFLSWRTAERLRAVGLDPAALGAQLARRLTLFTGPAEASAVLPSPGFGLSRRALDGALRNLAVASGAELAIDRARQIEPGLIVGEAREWRSDTIMLAAGKHDVRGEPRPRAAADPALGLRLRVPPNERLAALIGDRIELHLFPGGYAGIVLQEDGSANICMALRKSLLAEHGRPRHLLDVLAAEHSAFGARMAFAGPDLPVDSIGSVPYGWVARDTAPGLYRLGDQAAVIPSLAGEGMAIALASGEAAARAWLKGDSAPSYQRAFARRAARPVRAASVVWGLAEQRRGARMLTALTRHFPALARSAMALTRI